MHFVSRQIQWPDGIHIVEVSAGSVDYANPDMLTPRWRGEGQEYLDPREAVEAAITIARLWKPVLRRSWRRRKEGRSCPAVRVGYGATAGFTMPFDPCSFKALRAWAEARYTSLPKCACCGELLGKNTYSMDLSDESFCSERCTESACAEDVRAYVLCTVQEQLPAFQGRDGDWSCSLHEDSHVVSFTPTDGGPRQTWEVNVDDYRIIEDDGEDAA